MSKVDVAKVWSVTIGAIALPSVAQLKDVMQLGAALLAAAYTLWKWYRSAKKKRSGRDE